MVIDLATLENYILYEILLQKRLSCIAIAPFPIAD